MPEESDPRLYHAHIARNREPILGATLIRYKIRGKPRRDVRRISAMINKQSSNNPPLSNGRDVGRRSLLKGGIAIATSGLLPASKYEASDDNLPPHVPSWMREQGAPILNPPYGQPSPFEKHVIRRMRAPTPIQTAASPPSGHWSGCCAAQAGGHLPSCGPS
jgi:hypothetical protein